MSVLSAMLLAPTAIAAVSEHLKASDFYRSSHGVIFDVAPRPLRARRAGRCDHRHGQARGGRRETERVGGRGKIHEIAAWASASGNAGHYALIVRDHS